MAERPSAHRPGWILAGAKDYEREYAVDLVRLRLCVAATQPCLIEALDFDHCEPRTAQVPRSTPRRDRDARRHRRAQARCQTRFARPKKEARSKGILDAINMDCYRVEQQAAMKVKLLDQDAEIELVPARGGGRKPEPELDRLSNSVKNFNDYFGKIPWTDADRVHRLITQQIPDQVSADAACQNA